jgi:glycosyltransferase involved in cell wall biosynthesis
MDSVSPDRQATVAICTYNGAARIRGVLAALAAQAPADVLGEVLVIDNASTDATGEVAAKLIQELLAGRGRVVHEPQPGLSHARARAAREAGGEILCFLDDDNLPSPDFVAQAVEAFRSRPRAGAVGGRVLAQWEVPPTPLAEAVAPFALAICDQGPEPRRLDDPAGGIVGAGLCIRTELLRRIFSSPALASAVTDRKGSSLISGGDLAISIIARQLGWETWYVPAIRTLHCLPPGRMEKKYLLRLYEGIGRGQAAVRGLYDWKARTPLAWLIGLKDWIRWRRGQRQGPAPELRRAHPAIAVDLHELHQVQTLGRARQALAWPR